MVETERPHRSRRSTSEFFLCFSSRSAAASSSSSMKISSKSILSPGRSRESSVSLSSSLSRRLRSNGSMKGGQASPMFPTGSKKKGGSFEPPEPSSPKVTCIGQVRVKSKKKHGRKLRTRSQRRGEVSFRKTEQPQDGSGGIGIGIGNGNGIGIHHQQPQPQQRWVHLSLSICETLRAFGAEFNCFVPCGRSSSCSWSGDREKGDKRRGGRSGSCGAVFARWLFALQESEEKGRDAVGTVNNDQRVQRGERMERRELVPEIEMEIEEEDTKLETARRNDEEEEEEEIEEARESICIPPKNALLLMRSRSAPFRMSSLANRFWESPVPQDKQDCKSEEDEDELEISDFFSTNGEKQIESVVQEAVQEDRNVSSTTDCGNETKLDVEEIKEQEMVKKCSSNENLQESQNPSKEEEMLETREDGKENDERGGLVEENPKISFEESMLKVEEEEKKKVVEKKEERRVSFSSSTIYLEPESEEDNDDEIEPSLEQIAEKPIEEEKESIILEPITLKTTNPDSQDPREEQEQQEKSVLPECLLLMMCEPKLSMEVSKETWVCSNDFIRCRPSEKKKLVQKKIEEGEEVESKTKKMDAIPGSKTVLPIQQPRRQQKKKDEFQVQPPRSSCSKVEQVMKKQSMATAVEQKLTNAGDGGAHEPFVLKRCKSEPMRRTDKLPGEVCSWKKNKLESHHPPELHVGVSVGVGATGVGF